MRLDGKDKGVEVCSPGRLDLLEIIFGGSSLAEHNRASVTAKLPRPAKIFAGRVGIVAGIAEILIVKSRPRRERQGVL